MHTCAPEIVKATLDLVLSIPNIFPITKAKNTNYRGAYFEPLIFKLVRKNQIMSGINLVTPFCN